MGINWLDLADRLDYLARRCREAGDGDQSAKDFCSCMTCHNVLGVHMDSRTTLEIEQIMADLVARSGFGPSNLHLKAAASSASASSAPIDPVA